MATDKRPPDDLQEAVAATLRRLRGEIHQATPAQRTEPRFSTPASDQPLPRPPVDLSLAEPDLLAGSEPEIPPTPAARSALRESHAAQAQELARKPRLRWLRYGLSLAAVVVFAGIVWRAYDSFIVASKNGQVPVIAADQTPEKVPPADQGGATQPSQDKTVYDQISGTNTQPKTEVLLPAPETPQTPPPPPTPSATTDTTGGSTTGSSAAGTSTSGTSPTATTETLTPSAPAAPAVPAAPATTPDATASSTTTPTTMGTSTDATSVPPDLSGVPTLSPVTPAPSTNVATTDNTGSSSSAATTTTTQTAAVTDNFRIQLAALKSEAEANTVWKKILAKHNDVLGDLTVHIVRADLGAQGIYYRVQAGPFADKASAKAVCDKLKAQGQQCLVKP